jgi:hypothetical protein
MFRKPLLLLAVTLALSNFALAQEAPEYGPAKGTLLIIGGGNLNGSGIYEHFIELAGGKDKKFVIVTTAGGNKNADGSLHIYKEYEVLKPFRELGLTNAVMLHTHDPKVANTEEFAKTLRGRKADRSEAARRCRGHPVAKIASAARDAPSVRAQQSRRVREPSDRPAGQFRPYR